MSDNPKKTKVPTVEPQDTGIVEESAAKAAEEPKQPAKRKERIKLDDSALIVVKSNTFGRLIYINKRTGDKTVWSHHGEEQTVTMADLRAMKGTQNNFFADNMIIVVGCEDDRYGDVEPSDIYDALLVTKYYKSFIDPDKFGTLFKMSEAEIRQRVAQLSKNAKLNLVVALNGAISSGALDSLKKIRLFEELLGCELADPK